MFNYTETDDKESCSCTFIASPNWRINWRISQKIKYLFSSSISPLNTPWKLKSSKIKHDIFHSWRGSNSKRNSTSQHHYLPFGPQTASQPIMLKMRGAHIIYSKFAASLISICRVLALRGFLASNTTSSSSKVRPFVSTNRKYTNINSKQSQKTKNA